MMRFWLRFRDRGVDDFADAIRPELKELETPKARGELLDRIIASRNAGARVILPHEAPPVAPWLQRYIGAFAAVIAAVIIGSVLLTRRNGDEMASARSWFVGAAYAQTPGDAIPPVRATTPGSLHPFSISYTRTVDGKQTTVIDVSMRRDSVGTIPAWRIVSSRRSTQRTSTSIDSVHIAADDLRMLRVIAREAPYHSFASIRIAQSFDGLHVWGDMNAERERGADAHRTFDRRLPASGTPYAADALGAIHMMGVSLSPAWKGRLAILGWAVRDDDISTTLIMRVDGEERVRVPAGEFECWRIAIDVSGERQYYWVRKSDGLGIKSRADGKEVREIVLQREES